MHKVVSLVDLWTSSSAPRKAAKEAVISSTLRGAPGPHTANGKGCGEREEKGATRGRSKFGAIHDLIERQRKGRAAVDEAPGGPWQYVRSSSGVNEQAVAIRG
ncbi:unnamed protein product [Lota lota]